MFAVGVSSNKKSREAGVNVVRLLMCASNGTLDAESLMDKSVPTHLMNLVDTFLYLTATQR